MRRTAGPAVTGIVISADLPLAVGMAAAAWAIQALVPASEPYRSYDWRSVALAGLASAALLVRRIRPVLTVAGAGLVVVVLAAFGYEVGIVPWAVWIAVYTCFSIGGVRDRVATIALSVLGIVGYLAFDPARIDVLYTVGAVLPMLLAASAGEAVRARRAYSEELEARNAALERARALAAERLLLRERTRLARELHDAVGHAVNVMVMQAGVADKVFDTNPAYGRQALHTIADTGRDALAELDSLLGLLAPDGDSRPDPASHGPTLGDLPAMVQRLRGAGRPVEANIDPAVDRVPPRISRVAFRILQEALTNAARHAAPGRILVEAAVESGALRLVVRDEGGGPCRPVVPGRGLVNMAERSRMLGGSFEAGPVAGGFRVRATLPLVDGGAR